MKVSGLTADLDGGYGEFNPPDWFMKKNSLLRADILACWIAQMEEMYETAMSEFMEDIKAE